MSENVKVVIEVLGGVVTAVYAGAFVEVVVVDYDNIKAGDPGPSELEFLDGINVSDFMAGPMCKAVY
jgi:hypothetical protein